ncbi:MAG: response regulator, partial [Proteobacteria bacterium]|nr:response regulator [Pseudomonadota bacterium]
MVETAWSARLKPTSWSRCERAAKSLPPAAGQRSHRMISVLFVDDEANLRADLRRMFRSRRDRWSMRFASSGAGALDMLRTEPVDVVVSDMQMPGMSGAELLARVRRDYPETILIILSGQCDRRTALRTIDPVHLYLAKPCDPTELVNTIERAYRLRSMLAVPGLGDACTGSGSPVYPELAAMLRDPDVSIEAIASLIARDQGLTTKILQLVNAAYFGASWRVRTPLQAVKLLGLDLVRSLVLDIARSVPMSRSENKDLTVGESLAAEQTSETGIAVVAADEGLRVRFVNDAYRRNSGRGFDELIGQVCHVLRGPAADPHVLSIAAEGHDVRTTVRQRELGGAFDLSVTPLLDGTSRLAFYLCTQTELAPDDVALGAPRGPEPAIAFDELGEGLVVLDRDGRVVAVNPAFAGMFSYSPAEVVGQTLDFLSSPLHGREFYAEREQTIEEAGYW